MSNATDPNSAQDRNHNDQIASLDEVLQRQRAFWVRAETDRPVLHVTHWVGWEPYPPHIKRDGTLLLDGDQITPGLLDPKANLKSLRPTHVVDQDMICGWGPYDQCWTEAFLGCRIVRKGPSVWAETLVSDWDGADQLGWQGRQEWLDELLEVNQVLVDEVKGDYPISQPLLRGPLDMVEAALTSEMLYAGFYENPSQLRGLLERCADLFTAMAQARLAATPSFQGGYVTRYEWGLWAPGTTAQFQADASRNLSTKTYREFLFEIDRRIASAFDYSIIHTHSGSHHILPVLADEPELGAIEVTLDQAPYGPLPLSLLPKFQMIQQAGKSLFISGPMKRSELDVLLETLAPAGLAIRAGIIPG